MEPQEFRSVIKHFFLEGLTTTDIKASLDAVYGTTAPSKTTVCKWVAAFKRGEMSTTDAPRAGRPKTACNEDMVENVHQMVLSDRRISIRKIAGALKISCASVSRILHDDLGLKKIAAKLMPRELTDVQRAVRFELSQANLARLEHDRTNFFDRFVTVDETRLHQSIPEDAQTAKQWTAPGQNAPRRVRKSQSAGKIMATIFWDCQGIVMIDFLPKGRTITGEYYATLLERLNEQHHRVRPGRRRRKILLHHDNAPVHKSTVVTAKIQELRIELLPHPPYSPDLAPSDYFLFGNLKQHLSGTRFSSDEELILAVERFFDTKNGNFFFRWYTCD